MRNNEVKTPLGLRLRRRRSIGRWVRVLFLSVIAAIVFELILPPAWGYVSRVSLPYSPAFIGLVTWVLSLILFYVVTEPLRIREASMGQHAAVSTCVVGSALWLGARCSE